MTEAELVERARAFLSRVADLETGELVRLSIQELCAQRRWGSWSDGAGVYYFVRNDEAMYVGRASPTTCVGSRIGSHIATLENPEWAEFVNDPGTIVGVFPFHSMDWHWSNALETWLIDVKPRPRFNQRIG